MRIAASAIIAQRLHARDANGKFRQTFAPGTAEGLTEFAIGIAGMKPLRDDRGRRDPHGYRLKASVEAIADELACAAGLVCGKLNRTPACIIRGFDFAPGRGGVKGLLRPPATDLFR